MYIVSFGYDTIECVCDIDILCERQKIWWRICVIWSLEISDCIELKREWRSEWLNENGCQIRWFDKLINGWTIGIVCHKLSRMVCGAHVGWSYFGMKVLFLEPCNFLSECTKMVLCDPVYIATLS